MYMFFFFKQKTAYEMRISDWSPDVCSSDLLVLITFFGGCAGGTGGGVKVIRLVLFIKQAGRETRHLIHPSAEVPIKIENKVVPDAVVYAIGGFFSVYIGATILLTRSEEQTSEIQSLMRLSSAVFCLK